MAVEVVVQPVGDGLVGEALGDAPHEDGVHGRAAHRVGNEPGFGQALVAFGGHRMRHLVARVAIRGHADVPALGGVLAETVPGQLEHLADVPLGQHLLRPAHQDLGRLASRRLYALIGGEDRHADAFQVVFDAGRLVHEPSDAIHALADHRIETPILARRLLQQVGQAAIAGNDEVELVVGAGPAVGEVLAAGLDVPVEGDDHRVGRQRHPAVPQLAGQRDGRVLQLVARGARRERDIERVRLGDRTGDRRTATGAHAEQPTWMLGRGFVLGGREPAQPVRSFACLDSLSDNHVANSLIARAWAARTSRPSVPVTVSMTHRNDMSPEPTTAQRRWVTSRRDFNELSRRYRRLGVGGLGGIRPPAPPAQRSTPPTGRAPSARVDRRELPHSIHVRSRGRMRDAFDGARPSAPLSH